MSPHRSIAITVGIRGRKRGIVHVAELVLAEGAIVSYAELRRRGVSEHRIRLAVSSGSLQRLRRGWYGRDVTGDWGVAGTLGGAVTCLSALRLHGAWAMPSRTVHVRVPRDSTARSRIGVVLHRTDAGAHVGGVDDLATAIEQLIRCASREEAVVAIDSVLNRRLLSRGEVRAICAASPRGRSLARWIDPVSESGTESLARVRLRALRLRVRTQVGIEPVGRVDLLIGDRLILEVDGRAWHDRPGDFEADRARDRALVALGYLVLRASYSQVMGEWATIERQILGLVRQRRHLWRTGSR